MIKISIFIILFKIIVYLIVNQIRKNFQWFITKKKDANFYFEKNFVKKFKNSSYNLKLGWKPKKNSTKVEEVKTQGETGRIFNKVKYNFGNLSERKNKSILKKNFISSFGDSFVFCKHVEDVDTWQNYLSIKTKTNVLNFGVNNYGIDQALLRYLDMRKKIKSKIILVGFVPETIVRIRSEWKHFFEYGNIFGFKPSFKIRGKNLLKLKKNPLKKAEYLLDKKKFYMILNEVKKSDYWYKEKFLKDLLQFPFILNILKNPKRNIYIIYNFVLFWLSKNNKFYNNAWKIVLDENFSALEKQYQSEYDKRLLKLILYRFNLEVKKDRRKPVFILFPYKKDVIQFKKNKKNIYSDFFLSLNNKASVLDLTTYLATFSIKNINKFYHSDFYGSHLTGFGNEICAHYIYKHIKRFKMSK